MRRFIPAFAVSSMAAILAVPATYAVLRGYDVLFKNEPDPANVVWSGHIAMFWRVAIGLYLGGMVGILAYITASRDLDRVLKFLYVATFTVATLSTAQGILLP